jgi:hypothetical protein
MRTLLMADVVDADERPSRTSQPHSWMKIR